MNLEANSKFCPSCGQMVESVDKQVLQELYNKEKISTYVWMAIVACQALAGFIQTSAWAFAVWNAIAIVGNQQFCKKILEEPVGILKHYEDALIPDLIFLGLNLFLGGVIGAAGAAYDLYVRSYAMQHKEELLAIEHEFQSQQTNAQTSGPVFE